MLLICSADQPWGKITGQCSYLVDSFFSYEGMLVILTFDLDLCSGKPVTALHRATEICMPKNQINSK